MRQSPRQGAQNEHGPSRRDVLSGGLSNAVLFGLGAKVVFEFVGEELASSERMKILDLSINFKDELKPFHERAKGQASQMLDRALEPAEDDSRALMDFFREEIMHPSNEKVRSIPARIRQELVHFVAGQIATESSYEDAAPNKAGARSFVQITAIAAKDVGINLNDLIGNPKLQAQAMGMIFARHYELLLHETGEAALTLIQARYFDKKPEQFAVAFLAPALITAYMAGPTNVARVIQGFAGDSFGVYLGYDAFSKMSETFDPETKKYFPKVFAWTLALEEELLRRRES